MAMSLVTSAKIVGRTYQPRLMPLRLARTARDQARAFVHPSCDHGLHPVPLDLIEERADMVALGPRVADLRALGSARAISTTSS
jgi:hypothetical protein